MHARLLDILVCPACLPKELPLLLNAHRHQGDDIVEGTLCCPACGARYTIEDGLADLAPPAALVPAVQTRYDQERLAASYLWGQYADLWGDPEATGAYPRWLELAGAITGPALDTGCAVGRFTLELAARTGFAIGVDLSRNFVSLARRIAAEGQRTFEAPRQGLLRTTFSFTLPDSLRRGVAEFLRADALRLPFKRQSFGVVASLNVLDKLPDPDQHCRACQRVCAAPGSLLVADPFSWSSDVASPGKWLGGTQETGDSVTCLTARLGREPGWTAQPADSVWWSLRDHANHYERIRSEVVVARHSAL